MDAPLTVSLDAGGAVRVAWGEPDWLGPLRFDGADGPGTAFDGEDRLGAYAGHRFQADGLAGSVRAYEGRALAVLRIEATRALDGLATGGFTQPAVAWSLSPTDRQAGGVPEGTVAFGYQYTEFAMPTVADANLQGWFLYPARPAVVLPMLLNAPDGRSLLLAPLDSFHEQVLAVEDGVRWGWHGDLDAVASGFATELAILGGPGPRACLDAWGAELLARHGTVRPGRYADELNRRPSYWTDNGASYWYRTEPGHDTPGTLRAVVDDLRARDVPFGVVQLDSWFYPHEVLRPFDTDDWVVPPTGLVEWDARGDVLPDGIAALRRDLGGPPLAVHCRHLSSASPYVERFPCWVDDDRAHPVDAELYERWLDQAVQWGVATFEHDWLIECFLGVRGLREAPGRARAWQEGVDEAAGRRGLSLLWCMASPADMVQTVALRNVTSVRTSGDHGYLVGPGYLWGWFLYTNALADALGLRPFKDVFNADPDDPDAHADVEGLLSSLSTGPVAIGDRVGRADPAAVRRTCRADGLLVKPDTPVAALDRCFRRWATGSGALLVGAASTTHAAGKWVYVVSLNVSSGPVASRVHLADLGQDLAPDGKVAVWDWRGQTLDVLDPTGGWDVSLEPLDWDYRVVAPVVDGVSVIGDPALWATAGDMRVAAVASDGAGRLRATLLGRDESPELVSWTASGGVARQAVDLPARGWTDVLFGPSSAGDPRRVGERE